MTEPPLFEGADHESETWALPAVAASEVGAAGVVRGVVVTVDDVAPVPATFVADTLNTYA